MLKNYKISQNKEQIQWIDDTIITRNQNILKQILGYNHLIANAKQPIYSNAERWTTQYTIQTTDLHPIDMHQIQFTTREIKGDRAVNTPTGWKFETGLEGMYSISTNLHISLYSYADDYEEMENYLDSLGSASGDIYLYFTRNGKLINPQIEALDVKVWDRHNLKSYFTKDFNTRYRWNLNHSMIYYLNSGDIITLHLPIHYLATTNPMWFIIKGDINIVYLTKNVSYSRITYP